MSIIGRKYRLTSESIEQSSDADAAYARARIRASRIGFSVGVLVTTPNGHWVLDSTFSPYGHSMLA